MPFEEDVVWAGGLMPIEDAEAEIAARELEEALAEDALEDDGRDEAPTTPREGPKGPERDPADPSAL